MKKIGIVLLSIGMIGSLCGCQTTTPGGERKDYRSYFIHTDRTGLPSIAQQQTTARSTMQERVSDLRRHAGAESVPPGRP